MALARYYNNVAVGDLLEGELEAAREQLRVALHLDADYSDAWSNMGTVQRRLARPDLAEYSYLQALEVDPRNYTAMSNLALVLEARGSKGPFARAVWYYRQRNPYHQYRLAEKYFAEDNLPAALRHLRKAIRLKVDEAAFHAATAVVLAKMGRASGAARSREVALRLDEATGVRPPGAPGFIGSARFRETWGEYVGTEG